MTGAEHKTESREDLDLRFRTLGAFFTNARSKTVSCDLVDCDCCEILHDAVNMPDTMLVPGHEPREDLEEAVESIAERMTLAMAAGDAIDCPGGRWLREMNERALAVVEKREEEA